jgi:hypothetical protein
MTGDLPPGYPPHNVGHRYRDRITDVRLMEGCTMIRSGQFARMPRLRTVTLPASLEKLEDGAFAASVCRLIRQPAAADKKTWPEPGCGCATAEGAPLNNRRTSSG